MKTTNEAAGNTNLRPCGCQIHDLRGCATCRAVRRQRRAQAEARSEARLIEYRAECAAESAAAAERRAAEAGPAARSYQDCARVPGIECPRHWIGDSRRR